MKQIKFLIAVPLLLFAFAFNGKNSETPGPSAPMTFKDSLFDMCTVMPGDLVADLSPFGKPIKTVTSDDRFDGYCGCHYDFQSDDDYPQVKISVNQFASYKESRQAYTMYKKDWTAMYGRQPDEIANLGDSACFQGNAEPDKCDDCGLHVIAGRFYVMVIFKGYYEKISQSVKMGAAINIVRKLYEKKPYLLKNK